MIEWSEDDAQPLVLLVDEIDALVGDTLLAVLRQLRSGYDRRPASFPQSIVLCGVRNLRDYRIQLGLQGRACPQEAAHSTSAPTRYDWVISPRPRSAPS